MKVARKIDGINGKMRTEETWIKIEAFEEEMKRLEALEAEKEAQEEFEENIERGRGYIYSTAYQVGWSEKW
jgi:uncharacterized alpha-E superfamily protein